MKKMIFSSLLLAALTAAPLVAQTIEVNKANRTIAVTATDSAAAPADVATVNIGYRIYAPDAQTAYANGSKISNTIVQALLDAGIEKKSIESDEQQLQETGFNPSDKDDRVARRYNLSQSWSVHVPGDKAAATLDIAVKAGANSSGNIEWSLADDNALEGKAAAKALERAKAVAENMATGLNAKLGPLVYASNEVPSRGPMPMYAMRSMSAMTVPPPPPPPPLAITGKQIEKSATVYAVFAIE
jgi:uncharacterized protein YggE